MLGILRLVYFSLLTISTVSARGDRLEENTVKYLDSVDNFLVGELVFKACILNDSDGAVYRSAQCAQLQVPEDYSQPNGRRISLFVARIKSSSKHSQPEPLLLVAGGPGESASESFIAPSAGFHEINATRDLYFIDQRGTGKSNKLACEFPENTDVLDAIQQRKLVQQCANSLSVQHNLAMYTTSVAVQDLERVRRKLGIARWSVYGGSYGTRVAQHYLRRFPDSIKSLILDGVVPPGHVLGTGVALQSHRALEQFIDRCQSDSECHEAFPDLRRGIFSLLDDLELSAKQVSVTDLQSGKRQGFEFSRTDLDHVLRLGLYSPHLSAVLPIKLQAAYKHGNFLPLARSAVNKQLNFSERLSYGMHASVVCTEDIAMLTPKQRQAANTAAEQTYLGSDVLEALYRACEFWPRGVIDADFHRALRSDTPVLMLSGSVDPITPPSYAVQAAKYLSRSLPLVVEGFGHAVAGVGCMPTIMAKFLEAETSQLDTTCLQRQKPTPIFLNFNGPAP